MAERGHFIALEGIDGSGKSTQMQLLTERLQKLGCSCYMTKEPTDSTIGTLIRQILTGSIVTDNRVTASLFVADRLDHLLNTNDGLCRILENGMTVVCDRYYFSSYAYHSSDTGMDWVINANSICADILRPTVTVFLDIPPETALERIRLNRSHTELFEKEDKLRQVRENYFNAFARLKECENVALIDASGTVESVESAIWSAVSGYI